MNIFIKSVLIKAAAPFSPLLKKFPNIIWKIRYCKDYKKFPNLKKPQSFMEKFYGYHFILTLLCGVN